MTAKKRYLIYGLGFLIGLAIVSLFYSDHIISLPNEGEGEVVQSRNVVLGEVVNSKKPLPLSWALFYQVQPEDPDGVIKRIMIFEGTQEDPYWRVVERVRRTENGKDLELIDREIMAGDRVQVEIKDMNRLIDFEQKLRLLGMVIIPEVDVLGNSTILVKLRSHGPDAVPEGIKEIKALNERTVGRVTPYYFLENNGAH